MTGLDYTFPPWRDITDGQIPEHGQRCIFWSDGQPYIGRYIEHHNRFYFSDKILIQTRWWMPVPERPEQPQKRPDLFREMSGDLVEEQTDMFAG